MPSFSWQNVIVVGLLVGSVTVLGLEHVVDATWIEGALSLFVGVAIGVPAGHAAGLAKGRAEP